MDSGLVGETATGLEGAVTQSEPVLEETQVSEAGDISEVPSETPATVEA